MTLKDAVLREQGDDLCQMRFTGAEITGNPGTDFSGMKPKCVRVVLEELIDIFLYCRRNDFDDGVNLSSIRVSKISASFIVVLPIGGPAAFIECLRGT